MIATAFTELLDITVPVVSAPIVMSPDLVATVGNTGGLGVLPGTWTPPQELHDAIRLARTLTGAPIGVNVVLDAPRDDQIEAALDAGAGAVSLTWGDPRPYLDRIHAAGAFALMTVGSAEEARRAVDDGADVVVAQGWEAGGHVRGTIATLPLVAAVKDAVGGVPVLAAGGVSDGRGLAAVLALGADGAWVGTRFLASHEAPVSEHWRRRVIEATAGDAVHTTLFDGGWPGAPHRVLRNTTMARWEAAGGPEVGSRPGEHDVVATMPGGLEVDRYSLVPPYEGTTGDLEAMAMYAGQGVGSVVEVQSVATIVADMVLEAERIFGRLSAGT